LALLPPGGLIYYEPTENMADGVSSAASAGFFDKCDCPPWDTWIYYVEVQPKPTFNNYFVAWVPSELEYLAQAGINANMVQSIGWLNEMLAVE
jgi:hypothetical protein